MRYGFLFGFLVFYFPCFGQGVDSLAVVRKVDSLADLALKQYQARAFEPAIQNLQAAQNLAKGVLEESDKHYISVLNRMGRCYFFWGKYEMAEPYFDEALVILERNSKVNDRLYYSLMENKSLLYEKTKRFEEAEKYLKRVLELKEVNFGKESLEVASSLNTFGSYYYNRGIYVLAEPYLVKCKSIRAEKLNIDHPDYIGSLYNLGILYREMGRYQEAEQLFHRVVEYRKLKSGAESQDYLSAVNSLALLCLDMDKFILADSLLKSAIVVHARIYGIEKPLYTMLLHNLGRVYMGLGNKYEAEKVFLETLSIKEKVYGKQSFEYSVTLNNLGKLNSDYGEYGKAETFFLETLSIKEQTLGKLHPDYALTLNSLSILYSRLGDSKKSKKLLLECIEIAEKSLGKEHLMYADYINNLAVSYSQEFDYATSEQLHLEAADIRKKILGDQSNLYAYSLNNLGFLYTQNKKFEQADSVLIAAKQIWTKIGRENTKSFALLLSNLGGVRFYRGDHEGCKVYLLESLDLRRRLFGKESQDYTTSVGELSNLFFKTGQHQKAEKYFNEFELSNTNIIINHSKYATEDQLLGIASRFKLMDEMFFSFVGSRQTPSLLRNAFNQTVFRKGFLFESVNQRNNLIHSDTATSTLDLLQKSYLRRLSKEYAKPIAERDTLRIAEWEAQANTLEKELVRKVAGYGDLVRQVEWQEVRDKLQGQSVALEFIHFNYYNPQPTDSTLYAALLLLPNDTTPHFIPLFEERQLQPLLNQPGLSDENIVKDLYGNRPELAQLLWAPLEPWLRDVKTVYYSPSGLLHRINPAAVLDAQGESIADGRAWVRLGSTRELVTNQLADQSYAQTGTETPLAAIYGGIQYDMDSTAFAAINPVEIQSGDATFRKDGNFRYVATDGVRGTDGDWEALPATAKEAENIEALLRKAGYRTELKKGLGASEEHLKKLGANGQTSPRILHLATHGFAYPDPKQAPPKAFGDNEPTYKLQDDPMLRSGLLLAGSNFYWKNKRPLEGREDGVLVAYEVRDLNLRNTELAVLSACQTGLGDVVGSEGVYGLQRAFRIAGAKFLIVSLWQVPDAKTQELMNLFYQNYLIKKQPLREAFNNAQAEMRRRDPNPYGWAGFVLVE